MFDQLFSRFKKKGRASGDPALRLRPKTIGSMSMCSGPASEGRGTITVGTVPGGVIVDADNGHNLVRRMAINSDDVPAIAAALRGGTPIHRKSGLSEWSFVVKRNDGSSRRRPVLDGQPDSTTKINAMLDAKADADHREAMRTGAPHGFTPHCCTRAGNAWMNEQPYHSALLYHREEVVARLHDDAGKSAELAALLERAME